MISLTDHTPIIYPAHVIYPAEKPAAVVISSEEINTIIQKRLEESQISQADFNKDFTYLMCGVALTVVITAIVLAVVVQPYFALLVLGAVAIYALTKKLCADTHQQDRIQYLIENNQAFHSYVQSSPINSFNLKNGSIDLLSQSFKNQYKLDRLTNRIDSLEKKRSIWEMTLNNLKDEAPVNPVKFKRQIFQYERLKNAIEKLEIKEEKRLRIKEQYETTLKVEVKMIPLNAEIKSLKQKMGRRYRDIEIKVY